MRKSKTRVSATRLAKQVADSTDRFLARTGDSARKRLKARNRSALRTVGKVALVIGAGAATAYAGRAIAGRVNGSGSGTSRGKARKK
jgi:hypothetical protein